MNKLNTYHAFLIENNPDNVFYDCVASCMPKAKTAEEASHIFDDSFDCKDYTNCYVEIRAEDNETVLLQKPFVSTYKETFNYIMAKDDRQKAIQEELRTYGEMYNLSF